MTDTATNTHDEQSLTARISTEVVRTLKATFGKGPVKAKSYLLDDFLLVVMRGGMTVAEETILAAANGDLFRQFPQTYQNEIANVLFAKREALTVPTSPP